MKNERLENSLLVLRVSPYANKPAFNILSIEGLHKVGKMDEVCLGSFVGEYGFLSHNWVKLSEAKKGTFWHVFERQTADFVKTALTFWGR